MVGLQNVSGSNSLWNSIAALILSKSLFKVSSRRRASSSSTRSLWVSGHFHLGNRFLRIGHGALANPVILRGLIEDNDRVGGINYCLAIRSSSVELSRAMARLTECRPLTHRAPTSNRPMEYILLQVPALAQDFQAEFAWVGRYAKMVMQLLNISPDQLQQLSCFEGCRSRQAAAARKVRNWEEKYPRT